MTTKAAGAFKPISLALLAIALQGIAAAALVEIAGRLLFSNPYGGDIRYLYVTKDAVRNFDGFWTFRPDSSIREIATYESPIGTVFKGSDCAYRTDRLGFLDNSPAKSGTYDILILGDSFAQGQNGCSWVSRLRALLPGRSVYNAGMETSGVALWWRFLNFQTQNGHRFDKTIMLFISDDFFRGTFQWPGQQLRCLHDIDDCAIDYFYPIPEGTDVVAVTARRKGLEPRSLKSSIGYFWERELWVTYFLYQNAVPLLTGHSFSNRNQRDIDAANTDAFDNIAAHSAKLQLIRVPTKDEAALHAKNAETLRVDAFLASRGLSYQTCEIGYDGYGSFDGHPTAEGYARLAACIAKLAGNP